MGKTRPYDLGKRAETAARTRARILDAAGRLFTHDGFHGVSMEAVAEEAGVSRAAVYKHFKGKAELLAALHQRLFEVGQIHRVRAARLRPGAARALRAFLRENCRFLAAVAAPMGQALAGARSDPELRALVHASYMEGRRASIAELVTRLREERAIRPAWSDARVVDALMILTSLETYEATSRSGERSVAAVAATIVAMTSAFVEPK